MSRILVTGARSGLGRALSERLGAETYVRGDIRPEGFFDAIIHCAVNTAKTVPLDQAAAYLDDNVMLTKRLLGIPHRRFVYLSSIDVYPRGDTVKSAESNFDAANTQGLYAASKLFSEVLVRDLGRKPLILRPTTLLGPYMRPNTLKRMLTEDGARLFLSPRSMFNVVLHRDVCDFIELALAQDTEGTFNLASSESFVLGDVARALGLAPDFGEHLYNVGYVDQKPAAALCPAFGSPSWRVLNDFIETLGESYIGKGRLAA